MSKMQLNETTLLAGVSLAIVSAMSMGCSVTRESACWPTPARCEAIANWKQTSPLGKPQEVSGLLVSRSKTVVESAANPIQQVSAPVPKIQNAATHPTPGGAESEYLVGQNKGDSILIRGNSTQQKVASETGADSASKTAPEVAEKKSSEVNSAQRTTATRTQNNLPPTLIADPETLLGINGKPQKLMGANQHESNEPMESQSQRFANLTDDLSSRREHGLENAVSSNNLQDLAQADSRSKISVPTTNKNIDGQITPDLLTAAGGKEVIPQSKFTIKQPVDQQLASLLPGGQSLVNEGEVNRPDGSNSETLVVIESEILAISDLPNKAERLFTSSVVPNPSNSVGVSEADPFSEIYYDPNHAVRPLEMQLRDRGWNREFTVNRAARAYQIFDSQRVAELAERRGMAELSGQSLIAATPQENSRESRTLSGNAFQASHARTHLGWDAHQRQSAVPETEGELGNLMLGMAPVIPPQPTRLSLQAVPDNKTTWVPPLIRLDRPTDNQMENRSPATPMSPPSLQADPPKNLDRPSPPIESVPRWTPPQMDSAERFTERMFEREQKK